MDKQDRRKTDLKDLPGRLLLDTCVINRLFDEGAYIFDGMLPDSFGGQIDPDNEALRAICAVNQRAQFELLVSPLSDCFKSPNNQQ